MLMGMLRIVNGFQIRQVARVQDGRRSLPDRLMMRCPAMGIFVPEGWQKHIAEPGHSALFVLSHNEAKQDASIPSFIITEL